MRRFTRTGPVQFVASQQHGVHAWTGVSAADADRAVWTVGVERLDGDRGAPDGQGVKVGGARAVGLAFAIGRAARWPLLPWTAPMRSIGVAWLADRAYEFVARNRYRFPGDRPWCAQHPGECSDSVER